MAMVDVDDIGQFSAIKYLPLVKNVVKIGPVGGIRC